MEYARNVNSGESSLMMRRNSRSILRTESDVQNKSRCPVRHRTAAEQQLSVALTQ